MKGVYLQWFKERILLKLFFWWVLAGLVTSQKLRLYAVMFTGGKTPDLNARGYTQIMKEQLLRGEENEVNGF